MAPFLYLLHWDRWNFDGKIQLRGENTPFSCGLKQEKIREVEIDMKTLFCALFPGLGKIVNPNLNVFHTC